MPRRRSGSFGPSFQIRESDFSRRRTTTEQVMSADDSGSDGFAGRGRCSVRTFPFFRSRSRSRSRSWSRRRPTGFTPRGILRNNNNGNRRRDFPPDFSRPFPDPDDDDDGNDDDWGRGLPPLRDSGYRPPPSRPTKRHTESGYCTCDRCTEAEERNLADQKFYQESEYRQAQDRKADAKWRDLGEQIKSTLEATRRRNEQKAWLTEQVNGRTLLDIDADIAECNANIHRVGALRQLVDLNRPKVHQRSAASIKNSPNNRVRWAYPLTESSEFVNIDRDVDGYYGGDSASGGRRYYVSN